MASKQLTPSCRARSGARDDKAKKRRFLRNESFMPWPDTWMKEAGWARSERSLALREQRRSSQLALIARRAKIFHAARPNRRYTRIISSFVLPGWRAVLFWTKGCNSVVCWARDRLAHVHAAAQANLRVQELFQAALGRRRQSPSRLVRRSVLRKTCAVCRQSSAR